MSTAATELTPDLVEAVASDGYRFNADEFHEMLRAGRFGDARVELLGGMIVRKTMADQPHHIAVARTARALRRILPPGWDICEEKAMRISAAYHPLPDVCIVRGSYADDYPDDPPGPGDLAIVEVSDTTQSIDRGAKLRAYAAAGIPAYWVLDSRARRLDVHTEPSGPADEPQFARVESYQADGEVEVSLASAVVGRIAVKDLLPPEST
jgi:Uma2 family endonuclease